MKLCISTVGVMPAKAGIQSVLDLPRLLKTLDSGFRRNDGLFQSPLSKRVANYAAFC